MRTGRPIAPLRLAAEEPERLKEWARRPQTAQALALMVQVAVRPASMMSVVPEILLSLAVAGQRRRELALSRPAPCPRASPRCGRTGTTRLRSR